MLNQQINIIILFYYCIIILLNQKFFNNFRRKSIFIIEYLVNISNIKLVIYISIFINFFNIIYKK